MQQNQLRLVNAGPVLPPRPDADGHVVQFFQERELLVASVADYLADGLAADQPGVVIAREAHREGIVAQLRAKGFDTAALAESGRLEILDAHDALADFMIVNSPSPQRFTASIGGVIARVSRSNGNATVRAYGEMVDVLWSAGNTVGALRLEELWNGLAVTHDFRLFCAYSMGHFLKAGSEASMREICDRHTHVRPFVPAADPQSAANRAEIALLQERVKRLEADLRAREERERELQAALKRLAILPVQ